MMLPSQRRKIIRPDTPVRYSDSGVVGRRYDQAQVDVALRLLNTYEAERRRHVNMVLTNAPFDPNKFVTSLDEMPGMRRRQRDEGRVENVEDDQRNTTGKPARSSDMTIWMQVAKRVIEDRLNPEVFIRRQFAMLTPGSRPPFPGAFIKETAALNYHRGLVMNKRLLEAAMKAQVTTFENEVSALARSRLRLRGEPAWSRVLVDVEQDLTAMFRFCMSTGIANTPQTQNKASFREIADKFKEAAALEYVFDSEAYEKIWKTRIPAGFGVEADEIYKRLHGLVEDTDEEF